MRFTKSVLLALAMPALVGAQQLPDSLDQQGRSLLTLGVGLTGTRSESATGGVAQARGTGQLASFAFTHFVRPSLAVELSRAVLEGETYAGYGRARDEAFIPILFGLSYSPSELALGATLRPFVSVAAGPYIHEVSDASIAGGVSDFSQTVMGGRVSAGANWYVARHVMLQAAGDYHAVGRFDAVNGVVKDPSGFSFSLGIGFAWGR